MMRSEIIKDSINKILWLLGGFIVILAIMFYFYPDMFDIFEVMTDYIYDIIKLGVDTILDIVNLSASTYSGIFNILGLMVLLGTFIKILYMFLTKSITLDNKGSEVFSEPETDDEDLDDEGDSDEYKKEQDRLEARADFKKKNKKKDDYFNDYDENEGQGY
jgi:hypothetical protein